MIILFVLALLVNCCDRVPSFQRTVLMKLLYYDDVTVGFYISSFSFLCICINIICS